MTTVLGVIGIAAYIAAMVSLAAGVTWVVVRVSPDPKKKKTAA
ncbi:MAG TPA: hypothetical protein VFB25_10490 [Gaiellaceae bacterium]|nr:hypothetical protein [Gaiellaceae bacterium]